MHSWRTLNEQLGRVVRQSGFTVYETAKLSGLAIPLLGRFRAGEHGLTLDSAERLASALGFELVIQPKQVEA